MIRASSRSARSVHMRPATAGAEVHRCLRGRAGGNRRQEGGNGAGGARRRALTGDDRLGGDLEEAPGWGRQGFPRRQGEGGLFVVHTQQLRAHDQALNAERQHYAEVVNTTMHEAERARQFARGAALHTQYQQMIAAHNEVRANAAEVAAAQVQQRSAAEVQLMRDEVRRARGEAHDVRTQAEQQQQALVQQARMEAGQFAGRIRQEAERTVEQERGLIRDELCAAHMTLITHRATLDADADVIGNRAKVNEEREDFLKRWELTLIAQEEALMQSRDAVQRQRRELEEARIAQQRETMRLEARATSWG